MRTLIAGAAVVLFLVIAFGPTEGGPLSIEDTKPTSARQAEERTYLVAVEQYQNGAVSYELTMESEYVAWGKAICAKLDEGKDYGVALTYMPGWPQDAFGRAAVTHLCPRHIEKLPKLRS